MDVLYLVSLYIYQFNLCIHTNIIPLYSRIKPYLPEAIVDSFSIDLNPRHPFASKVKSMFWRDHPEIPQGKIHLGSFFGLC
jgi:hypothetical protein